MNIPRIAASRAAVAGMARSCPHKGLQDTAKPRRIIVDSRKCIMTQPFEIAAPIATDSLFLADWPLCQVRLMDDSRFPWLLLVPRLPGLEEWTALNDSDLATLSLEIRRAGEWLGAVVEFDKLNVAALGNIVRQMHVHVIGRRIGDLAWPGAVWGVGTRQPYGDAEREALLARFRTVA
jgi:diadenosine tetraphosphate (Ap4A) HIT family hydrolase